MLIRKLKLSGFKSFVEPAELVIEPGLTGIVGPNGCGKSNLLEAIRWVMGENSPRSLRSGGMEDVIFAGTTQRPSRNFAEVVLYATDAAGEELIVTRRVERGAGSAYRVNGRDVRAKDVALVFADAATGAHSPALVSQGRIAAAIAAKPTERRMMLEEAAGIAGLHVRRRDAENKLRQTEANLARLEELMAGLGNRITALRRQARQAERYTTLSEQIRTAEARVLFARWREAATLADNARAEAKSANEAAAKAQHIVDAAQQTRAALTHQLTTARSELATRQEEASSHTHRTAALASKLEAAEQRLADLARQQQQLEADRNDADRLTRDAADALRKLEASLQSNQQALAQDEQQLPQLERATEEAERTSRAAELALSHATAEHAGMEAEWRIAEAAVSQAEARLRHLDVEQQRLDAQKKALAGQGDPEEAVRNAKNQVQAALSQLETARNTLAGQQQSKTILSNARDEAASKLATARAELAGIEREWQALKRDREARARQAASRHGLPAALDAVAAEKGYERALAAVLGRDAKALLGQPDKNAEGRFWTGSEAPEPVAGNLAAHVRQCPPQLAARLALVHVADTDDGRKLAPGEWLVTRAGALRRWDGFVARGEGAAEAARLEAENRFTELDTKIPALQAALTAAELRQKSAQDKLAAVQQTLVASERAVMQASEQERQSLRELDQAESSRNHIKTKQTEIITASQELAERFEEAKAELLLAQQALTKLPDRSASHAALDAARTKNDTARSHLQSATAALAAHHQAIAIIRERISTGRADIKGWKARAGDAEQRLANVARRLDEITEERATLEAKPQTLKHELASAQELSERLNATLSRAKEALASIEQETSAAEIALATANEALLSTREHRAAATAKAENADIRRTELAQQSGERFHCPPPLLGGRTGFDTNDVTLAEEETATLDRLVAERERIGAVNLVASQELAEIEKEHGTSNAERTELAEAVNRLRGSIGSLNREGRERLRAAFTAVDAHFQRLFTRLFAGGEAHLALIDSDDPLEAGLEIFAQPPGKRLQSLTLLSGGEQALTALALIFALFLTNPAPICVLDEVDAPLDDANIDRFCDLLDSMVLDTRTRYLIVTHNAVTMSRMHRLFGVTMVEQGVSRLVSVDLGGAEDLLAAAG